MDTDWEATLIKSRRTHYSLLLFSLLILNACGGGGGGGSSDNNRAPFINNSSSDYDVQENQTEAFTVTAGDPDGDQISFSLSGTDASNFSIDSSGDVSFNTAPDFENPADEGADNTYELTVSVSDGSLSAAKSFTVRITDDPSDNPNTEPTCDVYITEGDIAIQNAEQCEMTRGGLFREFIKYVPQSINANNESAPIVFVLHGYTSYDDWIFDYSNFQTQADEHGLILIFPQGSIYQPTQATHWNVGGWTSQSTTDDIDFIDSIIDYLDGNYLVNLNRIYSTGMSNGGFMSYVLACQLSHRIAGIASVTGSMTNQTFNECDAKHPTPVMQIHGAKDNTVPYAGNNNMKPIDDVMEFWVNYNACNVTPSETVIEDNDGDGLGGTISVYNGCMNDVSVELYYLDGLGHQWPSIKGTRVFDIDSASVIWEFFSKYNVDGLVE